MPERSVTVTEPLQRAMASDFLRARLLRPLPLIGLAAAALVALFVALLLVTAIVTGFGTLPVVEDGGFLVVLVLFVVLMAVLVRRRTLVSLRQIMPVGSTVTASVEDGGLHLVSTVSDSRVAWARFRSVAVHRSTVLLRQRATPLMTPVPRQLVDDQDVDAMRRHIAAAARVQPDAPRTASTPAPAFGSEQPVTGPDVGPTGVGASTRVTPELQHAMRRDYLRASLTSPSGALSIVAVALIVLVVVQLQTTSLAPGPRVAVAVGLAVVVALLVVRSTARRATRVLQTLYPVGSTASVEAAPDALHIRLAATSATMPWSTFQSVRVLPAIVLVRQRNSRLVSLLPRVLVDDAALQRARDAIASTP